MQNEILSNINNPQFLEQLYKSNKQLFTSEFKKIYHSVQENIVAQVWFARLQNNFTEEEKIVKNKASFIVIIISCLMACVVIQFPKIFGFNEEVFLTRNISFLVFPFFSFYFFWLNKDSLKKQIVVLSCFIISIGFINLLPNQHSDTTLLSQIHLPLFIWFLVGISFVGSNLNSTTYRINFLRLNADVLVMGGLLFIASMILSGMTIALFGLIGMNIEKLFFDYFFQWILVSIPLLSVYIVQSNPKLVNKISPLIAKIFSPIILVTLLVYLIAIITSNKTPYNNREFLLIFNGLILAVMVMIAFSLAENARTHKHTWEILVLFALSVVTIIINIIAVSAILLRIGSLGITPNRTAVLGGNILMLIHLILISFALFKSYKNQINIDKVEKSITSYLPIYIIWTIIVTFIFPLIFNFR